MTAKIVEFKDRSFSVSVCDLEHLVSAMEVRDAAVTSINRTKSQRQELQDKPKFSGFLGPSFDLDDGGLPMLRYESIAAYTELSR